MTVPDDASPASLPSASSEIEARIRTLRSIANEEIKAHRDTEGFLAAALDGSLATGAIWPTSDLDFTIIPQPGTLPKEMWVEWGQRDGIVWHKHLTFRSTLRELMEGYPHTFIQSAQGPFNSDANWFLDGLAEMAIVEDPTGLLEEVKTFVAARRFAPEVKSERRKAFLVEIHRLLDEAKGQAEAGNAEEALNTLGGSCGFAEVAAHLWLEGAERMYSSKEQDRLFAEAAPSAGHPEAHALYHAIIGVDKDAVEAVSPVFHRLGEAAFKFHQSVADAAPEGHHYHRSSPTWGAWTLHYAQKLSIAGKMDCPALPYANLRRLHYWVVDNPGSIVRDFRNAEMPMADALVEGASELQRLHEEASRILTGSTPVSERVQSALRAAEDLARLTETSAVA